ncbi:MAG TPA: sigma-70 family RNA polymerase sigma factor [Vicinamibacterales bacterium]|nr:sigma-70 family RNA polymerase sigma factor [Vicinamibacterales bacterium]
MPESQAVSVSSDPAERLAVLFDTHQARLYRLARRLTGRGEEARDLVQETFLRAARSPGSVPAGASREEAWLVRVLINVCRDGWRKRAVRTRLDPRLDRADASRATQEDALIARSDVWRALGTLTPHRRAILILYELEGASVAAIASTLGVAPVTVRWHLSRGRKQLAAAIRGANEPQGEQS